MKSSTMTLIAVFCMLLRGAAYTHTFFVDPQNGSMTNEGTETSPWSTLEEVFDSSKIQSFRFKDKPAQIGAELVIKNENAPVQPGDTLMLKTGFHGSVFASEYYNADYITIMAAPGHTPTLSSLELRSACKWIVSGLTISPSFAPEYEKGTLVQFSSHGWSGPGYDCIIENCTGFSVRDASGWTVDDWNDLSCSALSLSGNNMIARNNHFKNINFGISVTGDSALVEHNTIENFAGDGLRGTGDYGTYLYNVIKNCYDVNANHDDGFQSWSRGEDGSVGSGVVRGVVLRGNTIINYEDPDQPHRGTLQGIGCFDGMFEDWVIENNVIMVDHWHGITLLGATNCRIVNNTVVDLNTQRPGPPWIQIGDHKDSTQTSGCVIRNNLSTSITEHDGVVTDHNIIIDDYEEFFVDYPGKDLRLKPGCIAIDSGSYELAPRTDHDGRIRAQTNRIDIGAYESASENSVLHQKKRYEPISGTTHMRVYDLRGRMIKEAETTGEVQPNRIFMERPGLGENMYIVQKVSATGHTQAEIILNRF